MKKIAIIAGLIIIILGITLVNVHRTAPTPASINVISATGTVTLALTTGTARLTPNVATPVQLTIASGTSKVSAASVELTYDATKLQVISVTSGGFLSNVLASPKISSGVVTFTYAAPPDSGGIAGSGTLATLSVKPLKTGQSTLAFGANSLVAVVGQTSNMLKTADPLTLTTRTATDLNGDKVVNALDYNLFIADFGKTGDAGFVPSDIDRNGKVDILDYNLLITDFGKTTP